MAERDDLRLTSDDLKHQQIMRDICERMNNTPYALKGGTALLLAHGLNRHSEDLDFNSIRKLNIEGRIRDAIEANGAKVTSLKVVRDTDTVQRYKIHYDYDGRESANDAFAAL